jgi:lipopolysaccharide/colanic/teichoic acid biosynthesis glycosyltransferase
MRETFHPFQKKNGEFAPILIQDSRKGYFYLKRIVDLVITLSALVLLFPIIILISILIKIDCDGPVFFVQKRVGSKRKRNGEEYFWQPETFKCLKFRTMEDGCDESIHQEYTKAFISNDLDKTNQIQGGESDTYKLLDDPRVTRIGRYLRKYSLDELPQLFNIISGDMSLVGPRPPIPYEVEVYQPWHYRRFEAKPGLTGLWQVTARSSADFDEMVHLDIEYVDRQCIWLDIKIILKTPRVILSTEGAY